MNLEKLKYRCLTEDEKTEFFRHAGERAGEFLDRGVDRAKDIENPLMKAGVLGGTGYLVGRHFRDRKKKKPDDGYARRAEELTLYYPHHVKKG